MKFNLFFILFFYSFMALGSSTSGSHSALGPLQCKALLSDTQKGFSSSANHEQIKTFYQSIFKDMGLEQYAGLEQAPDVIVFDATKKFHFIKTNRFPGFIIKWGPFSKTKHKLNFHQDKIITWDRPVNDDAISEVRYRLSKALFDNLISKRRALSQPLTYKKRVAKAFRLHAEKIHKLLTEIKESHPELMQKVKRGNPLHRLIIKDFIYFIIPGYSVGKLIRFNKQLLEVYEANDKNKIESEIKKAEKFIGTRAYLTQINKSFWLGLGLMTVVQLGDLPEAIGLAYSMAGGLSDAAVILEESELFKNIDTTTLVIERSASETLNFNIERLASQFDDLKEIVSSRDYSKKKKKLLLQNYAWDIELVVEDAAEISEPVRQSTVQKFQDIGALQFLLSHEMPVNIF